MTTHAIPAITPEIMRQFGAESFDDGLGVNDHGMPPGSRAAKDWEFGWHTRRVELAQAAELAHQST
jgi:hypothetical protein